MPFNFFAYIEGMKKQILIIEDLGVPHSWRMLQKWDLIMTSSVKKQIP